MSYRGEDLDLRTPQGWGSATRDGAPTGIGRDGGQSGLSRDGALTQGGAGGQTQPNWLTRTAIFNGGRADPLWVDDVVMGCCNHAFDMAVTHRATEVRLEHLINAMTHNEAAQAALESRGLKVATLRRDSAQVIAGELPAGGLNGRASPRKSEDFEEVLRLAADRAYPRRAPVSVDDILAVLFDSNRNLPAVALLMRHAAPAASEAPRWDGIQYGGRGYGDPRYMEGYEMRRPMPPQVAYAPAPSTDMRVLDRLEALDRTVRDLAEDMGADRKALASAMTTIQTTLAKTTDDEAKRQADIAKRLDALESRLADQPDVAKRFDEIDRSSTLALDRLARFERMLSEPQALIAGQVDGVGARLAELHDRMANMPDTASVTAPLVERLATLEHMTEARAAETGRTVAFIGERLRAFESQVGSLQTQVRDAVESFSARGAEVIRVAAGQDAIGEKLDDVLGDRFASIEAALADNKTASAEIATAHVQDLIELHDVLEKLSANQTTLAGSLEQWRLDTMGDLSIVSNRLAALEAAAAQPWTALQNMESKLEEMRFATTARGSRWRRFKLWLFGTEDWRSDVGLKNTRVGDKLKATLRREKV